MLTTRGRAALTRPPHLTIPQLWQRRLNNSLLDDFSRVEEIKGQRSANVLTAAKPRRKLVPSASADCPLTVWAPGPRACRRVRTLLRGGVGDRHAARRHQHADPRRRFEARRGHGGLGPGEAEVGDLRGARAVEQHVGRLHVLVHQISAMGVLKPAGRLDRRFEYAGEDLPSVPA